MLERFIYSTQTIARMSAISVIPGIYTVAGAHALRLLAGNYTRAGSKELKYGYSMYKFNQSLHITRSTMGKSASFMIFNEFIRNFLLSDI